MTRPRFATSGNWGAGLAAVALFAVLSAVYLTASFGSAAGFGTEGSITASIGYAMFDMLDLATYDSESFLVAFEIIDIVLVAALVGAVMLARREDESGSVRTALADGGRELSRTIRGDDGGED
jgi:NADH-quinone oxidoreductase subunit J